MRHSPAHLKNSVNGNLDSYAYLYNPANQRTNLTRVDSSTVAYRYDNIGQLVVADSSVTGEDTGYSYDHAWNVSSVTNSSATNLYSVNGLNELTNWTAGAAMYDGNGNLMTRTNDFNAQYYYDDENRLIAVVENGGATEVDFVYDGLGRLRSRWKTMRQPPLDDLQTELVHYLYDGFRVIQERDLGNNPTISYTRGNDLSGSLEGAGGIGGLLARTTHAYPSGNPVSHSYYFSDGNGNITYMLDNSQSMVASYRYDPFGNTVSKSGSLADANLYRFSSKEINTNLNTYYYGYRFYDPSLQRWLNRDPIEERGGLNLFTFVGNSPITAIDPKGRYTLETLGDLNEFYEQEKHLYEAVKKTVENAENCKSSWCLGVASPVAYYCKCIQQWENVENLANCMCVQVPFDRECKDRIRATFGVGIKLGEAIKRSIEGYKKAIELAELLENIEQKIAELKNPKKCCKKK